MARSVTLSYFYVTFFLVILETGRGTGHDLQKATAPGDFIIGGIFPVHDNVNKSRHSFEPLPLTCVRFTNTGVLRTIIMVSAVDMMNRSPLLTAANITLGYHILDSCSVVAGALTATDSIMHHTGQPIMAVVGEAISELSIAIARQLGLQMIPQISYSSTAATLSDKTRFPAFMRTIPSDVYQTAAMATLCSRNGWNWVGMVITDGDYGRSALDHFVIQASEMGICLAYRAIVPLSCSDAECQAAIKQTVTTILNYPKAQVVVCFTKSSHMKSIFFELKRQVLEAGENIQSMRRVWLASDSWATAEYVMDDLNLEDVGHIVSFISKSGDTSPVNEFLKKVEKEWPEYTKNNSFLKELFRIFTEKGLGITEALHTMRRHLHGNMVLSIEMAVSAIAQALVSICKRRDCKKPGAVQPWEVLETLLKQDFTLKGKRYMFDRNGDINLGYDVNKWWSDGKNVHVRDVVAEYHPHSGSFTFTNNSITKQFLELQSIFSKCSNSCASGEFKKTVEGQHTCCYECVNCTENYYSNATDMDQCLSCDTSKEWSAEGSSNCTLKDHLYFSWQDPFAAVLLAFAALGILLTALVSVLFLLRRDTPVVKAAGGPLSQVILYSLVISDVSAILFVGTPNRIQCMARQVLFGMSFTLCVSCILVKTLQILLAFQFNPALQQVLRRLFQPYVIVSICVAIQGTICTCWLYFGSPYHNLISHPTTLLEECHEGSPMCFGVMLGFIALLAFVCFICAFKGRKLPQHYNEARFITFSMLLYLISWMLFIPIYLTTSGMYLPAVEMVVILISNYGILCCHFIPKCYVILFKKEQNTTSAFRQNLYEYSSRSSMSVSESDSPSPKKDPIDFDFSNPSLQSSTLSESVVFPEKAAVEKKCDDDSGYEDMKKDMLRRDRRKSI